MSTKFGFLIDFDLLKAAISTNAKPEIVLRAAAAILIKRDDVHIEAILFPVSQNALLYFVNTKMYF